MTSQKCLHPVKLDELTNKLRTRAVRSMVRLLADLADLRDTDTNMHTHTRARANMHITMTLTAPPSYRGERVKHYETVCMNFP